MAASKHMRIKKELESMRAGLAGELRERSGIVVEHAADPMDQILSIIDREYRLAYLQRTAERYRDISGALKRIEKGEYGICMECEERISPRRLEAIPWAAYCVSCQDRLERLREEMGEPWNLDAAA
jgi:DnaK suppressor protein